MKATILNLAINNIKSIRSAIEKICETKVISNKNEFTKTDIVILPGNGSFGKGIEEINYKYKNYIQFRDKLDCFIL